MHTNKIHICKVYSLTSFNQYMQFCNLHHSQDTEHLCHLKKFSYTPLQSIPSPPSQPLATTVCLLSLLFCYFKECQINGIFYQQYIIFYVFFHLIHLGLISVVAWISSSFFVILFLFCYLDTSICLSVYYFMCILVFSHFLLL